MAVTARAEAVAAGSAWLMGTDTKRIVAEAWRLVADRPTWPVDEHPYGDGKAAARVLDAREARRRRS